MRTISRCVIAVLILKCIAIEAACTWNVGNPGTECRMQCITSNTTAVVREIEQLSFGKEDCRNNGIWLRLQSLTYPNSTIPSLWFTADVKVFKLEVSVSKPHVQSVSADAFNSNAFRTVKILIFDPFELEIMPSGMFNGLSELETINIKSAKGIIKIEKGVLDTLTELKEFTLEQSLKSNPDININGLTGSEALSKLEYFKIKYNLTNTINKNAFKGLTNIKHLDLSLCQIKYIEDNSFDPISETIEELDLSANALTTLSSGLFRTPLPNIKMIYINGNSWRCDCDLIPFRLFIEQYQQNFNGYECSSPTECKVSNMLESECFSECDIPPTSENPSTPEITTPTTPQPPTSPPNTNFMVQCDNTPETVSVKRPIGYMTITESENGEINLNFENDQEGSSAVIIWFNEAQNSGYVIGEEINCISKNDVTSVPITKLADNVIYSFCLMDKSSTSVSPLDCKSYVKRQYQTVPVWLYESSRTLTVTLMVVSLIISVVIGIAIGFCVSNHRNNEGTNNSMEAKNSMNGGNNTNHRMSNVTSCTNNTMLTSTTSMYMYHNDPFNCPPLPERPSNIFEEPIYASVDDK